MPDFKAQKERVFPVGKATAQSGIRRKGKNQIAKARGELCWHEHLDLVLWGLEAAFSRWATPLLCGSYIDLHDSDSVTQ